MNSRRPGFTLIEFLVVAVLATLIMGAAYQTLFVQDRTFRTMGEMIRGQDALRVAVGIMEAELREVVTNPTGTGGPDIVLATRDSVVLRAQRRLGFVCAVAANDKRLFTWSPGGVDLFEVGDAVVVFSDNVPNLADDDAWVAARISQIQSSSVACPTRPDDTVAHQWINLVMLDGSQLDADDLLGVLDGAPVRALHDITYSLYPSENGWVLARRRSANEFDRLVDGLAERGVGLAFTYLDAVGNQLAEPVDPTSVAAVQVSVQTSPTPGSGAGAATLTSHIHFRNN